MLKTWIKNIKIIDGSGRKPFISNLLIAGEKIEFIGADHVAETDAIIDGSNLCISPGFIDTHSHSDLALFENPELLPKIMQGITTEILGQDGISLAPLPEKYIIPWRKNLAGLDGDSDSMNWHYQTTANYLQLIDQVHPAINEGYLVPHGNIRMEAMGLANRKPDQAELAAMKNILRRELKAGAYGLSTGLIYMPCAYSATEEIIELCKVVAEVQGVFVIHQRSEADTIIESMQEVIRIGRESGVRIHFSHFKVCGKKNWQYIDDMLRLLEQAGKEGIKISFDQYPYVAGSTMLGVILPPWVHDGGTNMVLERLKNPAMRAKMINDMEKGINGWDNFIDFAGWDNIYVTNVKTDRNKAVIGLALSDIAKLRNKNQYDAVFDLLLEEENAVGMVDFYGTEDHVKTFMQRPEMNVCTDALLGGQPHPRAFGAFPRVLGKYVREDKVLTLEQAIYKMTKKAAQAMGIVKRGEIKPGYFADLVIFDERIILDQGAFPEPMQYPLGIEYVFVNGEKMIEQGVYKAGKKRAGRVLRRKNPFNL